MRDAQLCLFGPEDEAAALARACLEIGWAILQRRTSLTDSGAARLWGELALISECVDRTTETRLTIPRIHELRERRRALLRAPAPVEPPTARPWRRAEAAG